MNTMKGFYTSISSAAQLHGSYLEALSKITRLSYQQAKALQSELTWQNWSPQDPEAATRES
jgi:hypothetical protein